MTLGLNLNNPFNLEINPHINWWGQILTRDPKGIFCTFATAANGLRAGFKNLYNQQALHHRNTWTDIISVYAPAEENDTAAYVKAVADYTGVGPTDLINLSDHTFLAKGGKAVIIHEQGCNPFTDDQINQAVVQVLGKPKTGVQS